MNLDTYFGQNPTMDKKLMKKTKNTPAKSSLRGEQTTASFMEPSIVQALDNLSDNLTKAIDTKISTVLDAIKEQTSQIQAVATRIEEAERRLLDAEESAIASEARIASLEKQVRDMLEHVDDLDNRGRRCNVRVVGLPEDSEGKDPVKFLETWIPEHLQMTTKGNRVKLDRAHRSMAPKPGPNQRPRPLILKFHNFRDKQRVMEAARRLGSRDQDGSTARGPKISFYNDFSAEVVRRRRAFDDTKTRLKKLGVAYALLYPATLRVTLDGKQTRFNSPKDAALLVQSLEEGRRGNVKSSQSNESGDDKVDTN